MTLPLACEPAPRLDTLIPAQPRRDLPRGVADALSLVEPASLVALLQELLAVPTITGSAAESEGQS